jgi:hypothetical protein
VGVSHDQWHADFEAVASLLSTIPDETFALDELTSQKGGIPSSSSSFAPRGVFFLFFSSD